MKWKAVHTVLLIVLLGMLGQLFSLEFYKTHNHVRGDGLAYYSYLPASFVYHDPTNRFFAELEDYEQQKYWLNPGKDGAYLPKMTMGVALLWTPGYAIAHVLAPLLGYPQDGWSVPYRLSILLSGMIALLLGVYLTFMILRRWFSDFISGLTVLLIVFATHLLHYGVSEVSMSHIYTFALVAGFIHCFEAWRSGGKAYHLISTGFLLGIIVLIRPTNGIIALYPLYLLVMGVVSWSRLLSIQTLIAALAGFLPILLQMLFWKATTGSWIYYSYTEEAIYWLNPHLLEGLFSYRNGWLLYTPIFFLLIPGHWALRKVAPRFGQASLIVLILHTYITLSWWCWYYGDSLSIRPMADMYPMFAIALAGGLWQVSKWPRWISVLTVIAIVLVTYNNILFIKHYNTGKLTGSTMSKAAFWSLVGRSNAPTHLDFTLAYHQPDTDRLRKGLEERQAPDTTRIMLVAMPENLSKPIPVRPEKEYGRSIRIDQTNFFTSQDEYIELVFRFNLEDEVGLPTLIMSFEHDDQSMQYHALDLTDLGRSLNGTIERFYLQWKRTEQTEPVLKIYPWNRSKARGNITLQAVNKVRIAYPEELSVAQ